MPRIRSLMSAGTPALQAQAIVGLTQSTTTAGTTAADARQITSSNTLFTGGSGGAILPASDSGDRFVLVNTSGGSATIYPPTGATINGTTSVSMSNNTSTTVVFISPTVCHCVPRTPS